MRGVAGEGPVSVGGWTGLLWGVGEEDRVSARFGPLASVTRISSAAMLPAGAVELDSPWGSGERGDGGQAGLFSVGFG
nr:hypothetical protein GCM10020092_086300 [Actinoplanes digitatis]